MKPYNVEIFDRDLNYVCNSLASSVKYKTDIMDPEKYKVDLTGITTEKGYFIHLQRDNEDYIGIITSYEDKKKGLKTLTVNEVPSLFDVELLIDVNDFNYTFEEYIEKLISSVFINGDESMRIPMDITISSRTENWIIDYDVENEPDEDEEEPPIKVAFINLFDDVILPAFTVHQIRLDWKVDINNRKIILDIGKNEAEPIVIESDLTNIIEKSVVIRKTSNETNKVTVYNEEDYRQSITWYLHTDGSFSEDNRDRIEPVSYKLIKCKKKTEKDKDTKEEIVVQTFQEVALEKAGEAFGRNKYTNLIKLKMANDDELINPKGLKVGQVVQIISNGVIYESILTAREIDTTTTLIFGTIRLELTKLLKGRG